MSKLEKKRLRLLNWDKRQTWPVGGVRERKGHLYIKLINNKIKAVHRVLMEIYLKRRLLPIEVVHHKNHIKLDNRLENLQLMLACQHSRLHNIRLADKRT